MNDAVLFVAAFLAGTLNSVLGGGSFISFPALVFAGVAPRIANATNALALWPAGVASAIGYAKDIDIPRRTLIAYALASAVGAIGGALLLLYTPERAFVVLVPWLMLAATLIFTFGRAIAARLKSEHARSLALGVALQFAIAVYGGYFGGGMGILMLAAFAVLGMENMHGMNGLRSILSATINGVAVIVFVAAGAIAWQPAILMATGASLGGYLGAIGARRIDPRFIRALVTVLAWGMTAYFIYDAQK